MSIGTLLIGAIFNDLERFQRYAIVQCKVILTKQ